MLHSWSAYALLGLSLIENVVAIGLQSCVAFKSGQNTFPVVQGGKGTQIFLSEDDWPGVQRAARDFAADIRRVTNVNPSITNSSTSALSSSKGSTAIIIGTLGKSSLIDAIVNNTGLDVSGIRGQWEAYTSKVVDNPLPGVSKAYVIAGADKRGSIFALYDHSEQFGVSPWYWWADVPVTKHSELHVNATGCSHGSPNVKYRGIFLNDEQPALQNWAMEKFVANPTGQFLPDPNKNAVTFANGSASSWTGSPFNHFFYANLFELILRMRGNYLWPAIWSSAFAIDDAENQPLADLFGVVMGTSHQEPMMRSTPIEWNIFGNGTWDYGTNAANVYKYFVNGTERAKPYESLFTLGMRGAGDLPLSEGTNIQLLEKIVSDQRQILTDVFNGTDITTIPQMWCLYKEVEGYYEDGMRVPDDVTLLWTDDNWGNIRRFPTVAERNRTGGAGVYYHVDYVGDPRDYKWVTSSQVSKIYEQMSLALDRKADRIWILNVGDLKPYELSTEFFLTLGYDASPWNPNNVQSFVEQWAQREFGVKGTQAKTIAEVVANVTRFNARRKPELLDAQTYNLVDYREAETMLADFDHLNQTATTLFSQIPRAAQGAFFQMVLHPVQASATLQRMWINSGLNAMRASQARLSANQLAQSVEADFETDFDLETQYHSILNSKWNHMMEQTHVMYYYWQQPMANTMPPVTKVQARKQALAGPMRITPEGTLGAWPGDNPNQCAQGYGCPAPSMSLDPFTPFGNRFIDVGSGGPAPFSFSASANASWLKLSPTSGKISPSNPEQRVFATVDWSHIPQGSAATAMINFVSNTTGQASESVQVLFTANHTAPASGFKGFVEGDGGVSIEAAHTSRNTSVDGISWINLPGHGRTLSAITPWPRGGDEKNFTAGSGPSVEYDFFTFNSIGGSGNITVTTYVSPTLNAYGPDRPVGVAVQVDSLAPQTTYFIPSAVPGALPAAWNDFVANSIVPITNNFTAAPGAHTLKVWMIEPTVIVQKLVVDTGGVRASYLGPPESIIV